MKTYEVTWYQGYMDLEPEARQTVLATMEVEAESIDKVDLVQILSDSEREKFAASIQYCLRIAWRDGELQDATECVSDYGSHSRFVYVSEVKR